MNWERFSGMEATDFLYHEAPMVLLDRVISIGPDSASCSCITSEDNPFYLSGTGIPPWTAIEFMAQCVAVSAGAKALRANKLLPLGLLLGTMSLQLEDHCFVPGQDCRVESHTIFTDDQGMGAHQCQVFVGSRMVAQARLTAKEIERGVEEIDLIK